VGRCEDVVPITKNGEERLTDIVVLGRAEAELAGAEYQPLALVEELLAGTGA
jgi:hypothetical protein